VRGVNDVCDLEELREQVYTDLIEKYALSAKIMPLPTSFKAYVVMKIVKDLLYVIAKEYGMVVRQIYLQLRKNSSLIYTTTTMSPKEFRFWHLKKEIECINELTKNNEFRKQINNLVDQISHLVNDVLEIIYDKVIESEGE